MASYSIINDGSTTFGACGAMEIADARSSIASGSFKSWLSVVPCSTEFRESVAVGGVEFAQLGLDPSKDLTQERAGAFFKLLSSLPAPIMIQCASGSRASAVAALFVGKSHSWNGAQTLDWARDQNLKFMGTQSLRNWVASSFADLGSLGSSSSAGLVFRQLFEPVSSTYTYLLGCSKTGEAILIDPVDEKAERDATLAKELGLNLVYALNTHVHADHITGTAKLRAFVPSIKSVLSAASGGGADVFLTPGQELSFGSRFVRMLPTPGHTAGCTSFVLDDGSAVFTGDALLIRGCGRTDFQGGSSEVLWGSVQSLFALGDHCTVYPGHDYNGRLHSTIGEEKALNPRLGLGRTREEFGAIMAGLNLPKPKLIDVAVPANLRDGVPEITEASPQAN